ncbi:hypothetical protein R6Q59_020032 [Mikania micrantha]
MNIFGRIVFFYHLYSRRNFFERINKVEDGLKEIKENVNGLLEDTVKDIAKNFNVECQDNNHEMIKIDLESSEAFKFPWI